MAGGLAVIVLMFALTWTFVRPRPPAPAKAAVPVLIADFENATKDPVFDGTLERTLGVAVEEASFITTYNRAEAAAAGREAEAGRTPHAADGQARRDARGSEGRAGWQHHTRR